jgi:hypothetical protein
MTRRRWWQWCLKVAVPKARCSIGLVKHQRASFPRCCDVVELLEDDDERDVGLRSLNDECNLRGQVGVDQLLYRLSKSNSHVLMPSRSVQGDGKVVLGSVGV